MPDDLVRSNDERIALEIELDDGERLVLRPRTVRGEEETGTLFRYVVVGRGPTQRGTARKLLGRTAHLTLRGDVAGPGGRVAARHVVGIIAAAKLVAHESAEGSSEIASFGELEVEVRPTAFPASLGRDRRVYRERTAVVTIREVLQRAHVPARIEVRRSVATRRYTVQQDESDWAFVVRLCEEEGFYTWFDHEEGSILVVSERSSAAPAHVGVNRVAHRAASGLVRSELAVSEIGPIARMRPGRFALGSFDPDHPQLSLHAATGAPEGLEVYDAPGAGVRDPGELKRRAQQARERAAVEARSLVGHGPLPHLSPGRSFALEGQGEDGADGDLFVIRVEVALDASRAASDSVGTPQVLFEALPLDHPFRLARRAATPHQPGLAVGQVVGVANEEIDVDGTGRARVHHHWDRRPDAENPGRWSRVVQRGAGGSLLMPRVGWNVYTMAEEGSVDEPTIVSRIVDADHMPPYALPDNKTRVTFKTLTSPGDGSSNEIHFEDAKGAEQMYIHASRDVTTDVGNDRADTVKGNAKLFVARDQTLDVRATQDVHVNGNDVLTIGGDWREDVAVDHKNTVKKSQITVIGGTRKLATGQNAKLAVGADRDLKVGAAMLDVTLGAVKSTSPIHHVLVGGAVIKATPRDMGEKVGSEVNASMVLGRLPAKVQGVLGLPGVAGAVGKLTAKLKKNVGMAIQTIGAMKIELGKDRTIDVDGLIHETCGPTTWTAPKFTETSHGPMKITAAKLEASAEAKITITSEEKITLKVGGTVLEITPSSVKLSSKELQLGKASATSIKASAIYVNAKGAP